MNELILVKGFLDLGGIDKVLKIVNDGQRINFSTYVSLKIS